jgi:mlo protein
MAKDYGDRSLQETPTWAVAAVCAVFVIVSIIIEHGIHSLGKWFQKRQNKAMIEALEKIKAELMILGFISLLLTVGTSYIAKICIPKKLGNTLLPCKLKKDDDGDDDGVGKRKLLSYAETMILRRLLAEADLTKDYCKQKGKVSLISYSGVHQLHIFIFVLALFHVLYSVVIMVLAQAKMRKWKGWELETSSLEYQFTNDPARFRFAHQTSFVKRHAGLSMAPGIRWIVAFFRQFFGSISKVDYLAIRNGFINAHFAPNSKFDFHKYIRRSMEDDFKVVLGISMPLWFAAVVFLFVNVHRWHALAWLSFVPFVTLVVVGTKLELVIMEMAEHIQERTTVVRGAPVVEASNTYFWFNRPHWILFLIHFTLFQNAFQMAYFLWTMYEFGSTSCFDEKLISLVLRMVLGVALQILCSYITFPLYALVTQMGSHMKTAVFEEQTAKALRKWQKAAKERNKVRRGGGDAAGSASPMSGSTSPLYLLQNHNHHSATSQPPTPDYHSDLEASSPPPFAFLKH